MFVSIVVRLSTMTGRCCLLLRAAVVRAAGAGEPVERLRDGGGAQGQTHGRDDRQEAAAERGGARPQAFRSQSPSTKPTPRDHIQ